MAALLSALTSVAHAGDQKVVVAYGCSDLVVIGRLKTTGGDLLHDQSSAEPRELVYAHYGTLRIERIIRGRSKSHRVAVTYSSDPDIRSDRFRYVLEPAGEGYIVRNLTVPPFRMRPLAKRCEPSLDEASTTKAHAQAAK
ncbi:MAG: hypothetical protein IPN84_17140 [Sphingomonadales bacterium]|nr:hypothetical protein [Sphingomonadales bacterium]